MKKIIIALCAALFTFTGAFAQVKSNSSADSILGDYESVQGEDSYKVRVSKNADNSYNAQLFWVKDVINPKTGKKDTDVKNPDKSLRNVPADQIVLISGLKYNAEKKQWDSAKIYDPQRGIKANVTCKFASDGRLCLKGTIMGIGETVYWTPIK